MSRTLPTEGEPLPELCSNTVRDVTDLQRSLACSEPGSRTETLAVLTPTPDTASPPRPPPHLTSRMPCLNDSESARGGKRMM